MIVAAQYACAATLLRARTADTQLNSGFFLAHSRLQDLLDLLQQDGWQTIGPQLRAGTIVYDTLQQASALPWNVNDQQSPGHWSLQAIPPGPSARAFGWANSAQGVKALLFRPRENLLRIERDTRGRLKFIPQHPQPARLALFGLRPCDRRALQIQDGQFIDSQQPDPRYAARRQGALLLTVNCTQPSACCFCVSTGGSPRAGNDSDVSMTEIDQGLVCQAHSARGLELLQRLQLPHASPNQQAAADSAVDQAAGQQRRRLPSAERLQGQLPRRRNHPRWQQIGEHCLACGQCTAVCPTCFCHRQLEQPELDGMSSLRYRLWDSCFSSDYSSTPGSPIHLDSGSRYRQWLTHKLSWWHEQFASSGCVGCGRCISHCPAGIDLTAEAHILCNP